MSSTLLKMSLEMLEASCNSSIEPGKSKIPFAPERSQSKATISSIIKSKRKEKQIGTKFTQSSQPKKKTIRDVQQKLKRKSSKAEENLQKLLMFNSSVNLDKDTTQKLIKRAQTQKYVIPEPKAKEEETSLFTDEDFMKFEREYFCS